jgi:hypothetical protein
MFRAFISVFSYVFLMKFEQRFGIWLVSLMTVRVFRYTMIRDFADSLSKSKSSGDSDESGVVDYLYYKM